MLEPVIDIGRVRELQQIEDAGEALEIGAGRHLRRRAAGAGRALSGHRRGLPPARRRAGAQRRHDRRQHRQRLADRRQPADADRARRAASCCARAQERRELPLEDFFIDYGKQDRRPSEFVEAIIVPKPRDGLRFRAYKISKRFDQDISAVLGAFALDARRTARSRRARIAFGGMAATPKRARNGRGGADRPALERGDGARRRWPRWREDFTPINDWRASAGYRARVAGNLLRRLLHRDHRRSATETRAGRRPEPGPCLSRGIAERIAGGVQPAARATTAPGKHVTGEATYIDDLPAPAGLLHVYLGISAKAHARIMRARSRAGARGARRRRWC